MARETMVSRANRGDNVITNVDVRQGTIAECVFDGMRMLKGSYSDTSISGTTDYAIVIVDGAPVDVDFEIDFYFNQGKIGSTVTVTAAQGAPGTAVATAITGVSDDQLAYAVEARVTMVTGTINSPSQWKAYLLKKAVLG